MPRLGWHKRVEEALEEVGEEWDYEILRPRVIYFHHRNFYQFEYHPDVCWLYRGRSKEEPNVIIWEIESRYPDYKRVCGDIILGGQVDSECAECYPWKDETRFGSPLQKDVEIPLYGEKIRKRVYKRGERVLIRPNAKALFIIVEDYVEDFQRYIETIHGRWELISDTKVFSLPRGMYKSQMKGRLKRFKWLREKCKP